MKKEITKIWGVGLTIVLAVSLLFSAAPASAGTLSWGDEDLPDELEAGDILDIAAFPGGGVIYAVHDNGKLYRSTNQGESWSEITVKYDTTVVTTCAFVAVSVDDENYIAVATPTTQEVLISDDAGANWDLLPAGSFTSGTVRDLAISPEKAGDHTIAVAVDDTTSKVWHYELGAVGGAWTETSTDAGFLIGMETGAVAFSPNFASDEVLVAVTANTAGAAGGGIFLQIYSFNQDNWNRGTFADYPAAIVEWDTSDAPVTDLQSADIAMGPDYLGSDDSLRVLFVSTTTDPALSKFEDSGIYRMDDDDVTELKVKQFMHSVAFDGTTLVSGHHDSTNVRRSTDPLASSPSVSGATSTKRPGGDDLTVVDFAGTDVVAGTSGDESAFAISRDNGKTFNDISLIDTVLTNLSDVAVSSDGSKVYLLTTDATSDLSVWRLASSWERVLSKQTADTDYIVRIAPDDDDVIYVADTGGTSTDTTIYYTSDGGETKWHTRVSRYGIDDLAIEGDGDVAYVLNFAHVSKSTNSGFTWASKVSHKISAGANMLVSLGEDKLLAAGNTKVSYSTDGNTSWTKLADGMTTATNIQAIATGLNDGDFVFAITDASDDYIYRWEIGEDDEWDDVGSVADEGYGLILQDGVLYAVTTNSTDASTLYRSLNPTSEDPSWSTVGSPGELFNATPSALRASVDGEVIKLWAIDNSAYPDADLFSYKDTLAIVSVDLRSPKDGFSLKVNPISGDSEQIVFTWVSPSDKVTRFDFEIAQDSGFKEDVLALDYQKASGTYDEGDVISQIVGPGASGAGNIKFMPETSYYWRVRVDLAGPVRSAWSETRSFSTESLPVVPAPPVEIVIPPPPVISVPSAPSITIEPPEIVLPPAPAPPPEIVIPPAPEPAPAIPTWTLLAIIIIGAILVIALIVLIIRTRRPV